MHPSSSFRAATARRLARWAGLTLATLSVAGGAWAQSASNGASLYQRVIVSGRQTCAASACHGSAPSGNQNRIASGANAYLIQSGISGVGEMGFLQGHLSDSEINDLAAYIAQQTGRTAVYLPVATAPAATFSASSVAFGSVTVGMQATRTVTLSNTGNAALAVGTPASNSSAFTVSDNCPASLAAGSSCTLSLVFAPALAQAYSGSLTLTTDAANSPHTLSVSGTGANAATAVLGWDNGTTALSFADTTVGQSAAAQVLTLTNTGNASATLSSVALSGSASGDFSLGGTCVAGLSVAAGSSCTVSVTFTPTLEGARSATVALRTSDATNPSDVSLSGTGVAASGGGGGSGDGDGDSDGDSGADDDNQNAGGGGCTLGRRDSLLDPVWLLMLGGAAAVLWRRRQVRTGARHVSR